MFRDGLSSVVVICVIVAITAVFVYKKFSKLCLSRVFCCATSQYNVSGASQASIDTQLSSVGHQQPAAGLLKWYNSCRKLLLLPATTFMGFELSFRSGISSKKGTKWSKRVNTLNISQNAYGQAKGG